MANRWFHCGPWHQQVTIEMCAYRFKRGYKKCRGCEKGKEMVVARYGLRVEENRNGEPANRRGGT